MKLEDLRDIRDCDKDDLVEALEQRLAYAKELLNTAKHGPKQWEDECFAFLEKLNSECL